MVVMIHRCKYLIIVWAIIMNATTVVVESNPVTHSSEHMSR